MKNISSLHLPIHVLPKYDLFEPIPLIKTPRPPAIPDRVDLKQQDAVVYLHDVYAGPGLAGVPRGTVKKLRIAPSEQLIVFGAKPVCSR